MNILNDLTQYLSATLATAGLFVESSSLHLDYPENPEYGDYSSNVALAYAKKAGTNPRALAEKIVEAFTKTQPDFIESVSIAGPGFINFKIKDHIFAEQVVGIVKGGAEYGWTSQGAGKQVMVEYTDPNPFKVFHIGHLMSNAVGESISRLIQSSGNEVIRACYQGDVGLHVAKTIWGIQKKIQESGFKIQEGASIKERVQFLGEMYVSGSEAYENVPEAQKEIAVINKQIFEKSNSDINALYQEGRKWSLEYFDDIYARLGTKFDIFFFESEVADLGIAIVKQFLGQVFQESEGATIFKGEDHGVHTRVFITSNGLPTYETKELGLNTEKFKKYPQLDRSVIITANEQSDYFKVLLKVFSLINPVIAEKTKHISHGILRFASGKMSSRKGNIISAESLIDDIKELVHQKITGREFTVDEADVVTDQIAIAAIKYTILRQSIGSDVIFDSVTSVSFEGDSGPYLQYSAVRAAAVLEKAKNEGIEAASIIPSSTISAVSHLEKLLTRFPDIIHRARADFAPQHVAGYLIALSSAFNGFYASHIIVDKNDSLSSYRVAVTKAFLTTMTNGLWILGITVPVRM